MLQIIRKNQKGFIPGLEGLAMVTGVLISVVLLSLNSARAKSRDAKRLADVRQMAAALELYYNDNTKYPSTLKELTPLYIGMIPTPPLPQDGSCTADQNNYTYQIRKTALNIPNADYTLDFCLGVNTAGYPAGVRQLSPAGIR